jgi:hypothetical protein
MLPFALLPAIMSQHLHARLYFKKSRMVARELLQSVAPGPGVGRERLGVTVPEERMRDERLFQKGAPDGREQLTRPSMRAAPRDIRLN